MAARNRSAYSGSRRARSRTDNPDGTSRPSASSYAVRSQLRMTSSARSKSAPLHRGLAFIVAALPRLLGPACLASVASTNLAFRSRRARINLWKLELLKPNTASASSNDLPAETCCINSSNLAAMASVPPIGLASRYRDAYSGCCRRNASNAARFGKPGVFKIDVIRSPADTRARMESKWISVSEVRANVNRDCARRHEGAGLCCAATARRVAE